MIPKIEFRYSDIYDRGYKESKRIQSFLKEKGREYPSEQKIERYIKGIAPLWNKIGNKTLLELSKIAGLKWKEEKILCYVIGHGKPFSDPLTVRLFDNKNDFLDVLTHELIHQLFSQENNPDISEKSWDYFFKKYKSESRRTVIHVPLHAVHSELITRFFPKANIEKRLQLPPNDEYKQSWKIVQEEGHQNIINEFKKRLK